MRVGDIESPFDTFMTTYIKHNLNYNDMVKASKDLLGENDFQSFAQLIQLQKTIFEQFIG